MLLIVDLQNRLHIIHEQGLKVLLLHLCLKQQLNKEQDEQDELKQVNAFECIPHGLLKMS